MSISNGYKLVPVEPTTEMVLAGLKALGGCVGSCGEASPPEHSDILDAFSGMLAAAPTPPQPIYDEVKERELFEAYATSALGRDSDGYYIATDTYLRWQGWVACAQSRAKAGDVGHE